MRSMRGSTSSANGFPLIFRLIFRFIFTQPSVAGGAPDSSGPVVYDSDEYFGEMQGGGASFACRGGGGAPGTVGGFGSTIVKNIAGKGRGGGGAALVGGGG